MTTRRVQLTHAQMDERTERYSAELRALPPTTRENMLENGLRMRQLQVRHFPEMAATYAELGLPV